jgi:uncharacterized protein YjiS (DUF1127 family)
MSTIFSPATPAPEMTWPSRGSGLAATVKRSWVAHLRRRIEDAAIAQLHAMSDRELKDIGLTRSKIVCAARGEGTGDGLFVRSS